ncbi:haloacid dehalogenase-like hydrolase family protein [Zea mays]|jgi:hydroxymethylpyrimidine pyrophosphatase-like HAD family hydrolase|uniref:Haloacid dehalogenase-like hydrolase family protein n=1 Tax=Zea mays TaxID=4577 RepID=A0A1D6ND04_MAIZE|nr:haloacid dehalogenase-like hydrolase family protein [Zea mays]
MLHVFTICDAKTSCSLTCHVFHIQKVLFLETPERISSALRPYWAKAIEGRAHVVQAQPDMLELVPPATSKGNGVKVLLNHLSISPDEVELI